MFAEFLFQIRKIPSPFLGNLLEIETGKHERREVRHTCDGLVLVEPTLQRDEPLAIF